MGNELIYHYTTLNALLSMLTSDSENAILRLTRIDTLNDSEEYFDYDRILNIIKVNLIESLETEKLIKLNQLLDSYDYLGRQDRAKSFFIMSFTLDNDSIPMWNYYSNATGISIGFDKNTIIDLIDKSFRKVYGEHEEIGTMLSYCMIYDDLEKINKLKELIDLYTATNEIDEQQLIENYFSLEVAGEEFKNVKFEYEREFRVALFINLSKEELQKIVKFQATSMNIKPYIEIKIDKFEFVNSVKEVVISPLNTSNMIENGIRDFLESNGHTLENLNVSKSECTLRSL